MREGISLYLLLLKTVILILFVNQNILHPVESKTMSPQPFLPALAPSQLTPYTTNIIPKLSGLCPLNFSSVESIMQVTAVDCYAYFAPFLANVICCPQLQANIAILIGEFSKETGVLALDMTHANHCLSDIQEILSSQGAHRDIEMTCSVNPMNLTEGTCPIKDVNELESTIDGPKLLTACDKVDPVNECCSKTCENAILEASRSMVMKGNDLMLGANGSNIPPEHLTQITHCKNIILRWLASKFDLFRAKEVLRTLSNCNVNKACPLIFPNTRKIAKDCGNSIINKTACCHSVKNYISHLQKQSLITNLQALDCTALLGLRLQGANITRNIYDICRITLKDFTVQVGSQVEAGCLLPSLPSDATFDRITGVSITCDLNDNIAAPWPSSDHVPTSFCNNKTIKIPAIPAATSAHGGEKKDSSLPLILACLLIFTMFL